MRSLATVKRFAPAALAVMAVALGCWSARVNGQGPTPQRAKGYDSYVAIPGASRLGSETCGTCHEQNFTSNKDWNARIATVTEIFTSKEAVTLPRSSVFGSAQFATPTAFVSAAIAATRKSGTGSAGHTPPTMCAAWIVTRFTHVGCGPQMKVESVLTRPHALRSSRGPSPRKRK